MGGSEVIGRRAELDRIVEVAQAVVADAVAALVHVQGEAGIGKSTVVDAAVIRLRERGFRVLRAGISEAETGLAWAGLHELVVRSDDLDDLPSVQRSSVQQALGLVDGDPLDPALVGVGFASLVERDVTAGAVAIVIDDLHWLDTATAAAVAFTMRWLRDRPVLAVVASRPDTPLPVEPRRLLPDHRVHHVRLEGLSAAGLHHVVRERCGLALRRPDLVRLHTVTGGNPLHAIETGRLVAAGRSIEDAVAGGSTMAAVRRNLVELEPDVLLAIQAAALAAAPTVTQVVRALPDLDVMQMLMAAEDAQVVHVHGDHVEFRHPLLRTAALETLGGLRRRQLERRWADIVDDPDERAILLGSAATGPDREVALLLEESAERAATSGVLDLAIRRLARSIELTTADDAARVGRLVRLAEWSHEVGDNLTSLEVARAALAAATDRRAVAQAATIEVVALANAESPAAAMRRIDELLDEHADDGADVVVPILLLAANVRMRFDISASRRCAEQACELAVCLPELAPSAEALRLTTRLLAGEPTVIPSVVVDEWTASGGTQRDPTWALLMPLVWLDRCQEAVDLAATRIERLRQRGRLFELANDLLQLGDAQWRAGEWRSAEGAFREWFEIDRLSDDHELWEPTMLDLALVLASTGQDAEAEELVAATRPHLERLEPIHRMHATSRLLGIEVTHGRWGPAADAGRTVRQIAADVGYRDVGGLPFRSDLVEALVRLGAIDEAAEVAQEHTDLARHQQIPRGIAMAARSRALVHAARTEIDLALAAFDESLAMHATWHVPLEHGRTLLDLGATLRRAGRRAQAAECLDEADAIFERLGAVPWRRRVADERARLGLRPSADVLTPTQARVAELVAAGRSNAEIAAELVVSLRTVESNLTKTYRKLGIRSRTELVARLSAGVVFPDAGGSAAGA